MSDQYIGEIRMFAGNYAPVDWHFCDGSLLSISEFETLFALLGTTYGGDGASTFGLPDMRGRVPVGQGNGAGLTPRVLGSAGGSEAVALTASQLPPHVHAAYASTSLGNVSVPGPDTVPATPAAATGKVQLYVVPAAGNPVNPSAMSAAAVGSTGGGQPHANVMPSSVISLIIALNGIFPSRN
jgi:microcystin-dependent protein